WLGPVHRPRLPQDLRRQVTNGAPRIASSIWSRRGLCPRHPFTLSRQLVIRKSKYHGGRGLAEQPSALLDSREAPASLWPDTEPRRDRLPIMKTRRLAGFDVLRYGPQPFRVSYRYSFFQTNRFLNAYFSAA